MILPIFIISIIKLLIGWTHLTMSVSFYPNSQSIPSSINNNFKYGKISIYINGALVQTINQYLLQNYAFYNSISYNISTYGYMLLLGNNSLKNKYFKGSISALTIISLGANTSLNINSY